MIEVKMRDKEFLSTYDLDIELFNNYKFHVTDVIPVRKVYMLDTTEGMKILKKYEKYPEDLDFIRQALRYIKSGGFENVMGFERNIKGQVMTFFKGSSYAVMDLIDGRESEFNNPVEIDLIIKSLFNLHRASRNFAYEDSSRNILGKTISIYENKLKKFKYYRDRAYEFRYPGKFDNLFLDNYDDFEKAMKHSIDLLKNSSYEKLCSNPYKISVCHHDLANHNIIIRKGNVNFIDFDYSILDLRVHDLCNFINKSTKNSMYDFSKVKHIIDDYNSYASDENEALDNEELKVLYAMLMFPENIYTLVRNYYAKEKMWKEDTFINKMTNKIEEFREKENMLKDDFWRSL